MKTFDNVASLKLARLNANQFVETGGFTEKGGTGAKRYFTKTASQAAADGDVVDDVHTNFVLANGIVAIDTSKPVIEHYTLAEAKALTGAVIGQIIQITDRGNGQFKFINPVPNNTFNLIEAEASGLTLELIIGSVLNVKEWGVVGGALSLRASMSEQKADDSLRSVISGTAIDEIDALQAMYVYASQSNVSKICGQGLDIGIDVGTNSTPKQLLVYSNTELDMQGGSLVRLGSSTDREMLQNKNFSGVDENITIRNTTLIGTGTIYGVSDQGGGIQFWGVDNFLFEDVYTDDTNGDGILLRACNGSMNRISVGRFGRNGISPTDGTFNYNTVDIFGPPTTGANPALYFDAEREDANIETQHNINGMTSREIYFVDFKTAAGGRWNIGVNLSNSVIGPSFKAVRIAATNPLINASINIGRSNIIKSTQSGNPIQIDNVSGVTVGPCALYGEVGAVNKAGISVSGHITDLQVDSPAIDDNLNFAVMAFTPDDSISNSSLNFKKVSAIYLRGSNNYISADRIDSITFVGAGSVGNEVFCSNINSATTSDSALLSDQIIDFIRSTNFTKEPPQGLLHFTKDMEVGDAGSPTVDMSINLPSSASSTDGRCFKVILAYSHRGDIGNTAYHESILSYGTLNIAEVVSPVDVATASSSIAFKSGVNGVVTYTLTRSFAGKFTATVIG